MSTRFKHNLYTIAWLTTAAFLLFFVNIDRIPPAVSMVFAKEKTVSGDFYIPEKSEYQFDKMTTGLKYQINRKIGKKIVVSQNGNGDFLTIKDALNVAKPKDTIVIYPGVYYEKNLLLDNPKNNLTITGIDKETVILDGKGKEYTAIDTEKSTNLLIKNITFRNYQDGVLLNLDNNISIENSIFKDNTAHGIFGFAAGSSKVAKNIFIDNHRGLEFFNSGSTAKNVSDNAFYNNSEHGIAQYISSNISYRHNYFKDHPDNDNGSTVLMSYSTNTRINSNLMDGNRGALVLLAEPKNITTSYNSFLNSSLGHIFIGTGASGLSFFQNYYDDYTGEDVDNNGLGDVPYIIDAKYKIEDSSPVYNKIPFALFTTNTTYTDQMPATINFTSHGADYTDIKYMEWYFNDGPTPMKSSVLRLWRYTDGRFQIQYFDPKVGGQIFTSWLLLSFNTLKPSLYGVPEKEFMNQDGKIDYHYLFSPGYDFHYELNPKHTFIRKGVYNTTFKIESINNVLIKSDSDKMQIIIGD